MATKIAPFTLKEADICVRCGNAMPIGTEATWLRDAETKGYYHTVCEGRPLIPALVRVKLADPKVPLGYRWVRRNMVPQTQRPLVNLGAPVLEKAHDEGELIHALAAALMPKLVQQAKVEARAEVIAEFKSKFEEVFAQL